MDHQPVAPDWCDFPVSGMARYIRGLALRNSVSMRVLAVSRTHVGRFRPKVSGGILPFPGMLLLTICKAPTGESRTRRSRPYFRTLPCAQAEHASTVNQYRTSAGGVQLPSMIDGISSFGQYMRMVILHPPWGAESQFASFSASGESYRM
jgi:hypothetical protein